MSNHLRRITPAEKNTLPGATDADRFLAFGGVHVGTSGGDYIIEVAGADRPGLPGTFEAADYDSLHTATKPNVFEAEWTEPEDPEDPDSPLVRRRGKVRDVPAEAVDVETGIVPHHFA